MDCEAVREAVQSGTRGPEVDAHTATCHACAALVAVASALPRSSPRRERPADAALLRAVTDEVARERGVVAWLRSRPSTVRLFLALLVAFGLPIAMGLASPRNDFGVFPRDRLLVDLSLFAVPGCVAVWLALRPTHVARPRSWVDPVALLFGLACLALLVSLPPAHAAHPASLEGTGADFVPRARACFTLGTLIALPVGIVFVAMVRSARDWAWPLLLAGVAAALVGNATVYAHCALVSPLHLLAGHASVVVPLLVGAALLLRRRRAS